MVNKVILVGNLGSDPEVKQTPSGTSVANFTLATSESYSKKDGTRENKTEWHSIVAWGKSAEFAGNYLKKGKCIFIEGKIATRKWEDKEGKTCYKTEVIASSFSFVGNKGGNNSDGMDQRPAQESQPDNSPSVDEDDLPF